jgi:hypothetical protein
VQPITAIETAAAKTLAAGSGVQFTFKVLVMPTSPPPTLSISTKIVPGAIASS